MKITFIKRKTIIGTISIVLSLILSITILSSTGAYAVFFNAPLRKLPIYSVTTEENKLSISFDCAWGTDYTDKLLTIMESEGVKCTFFMVEFWVKKHPEYVKKINDYGHEIGTHSATHPYMSKLSKEKVIKELTSSSLAIEEITGKKVELFRPPYGDYNDQLIKTSHELGLFPIQWSVDSLDWKDLSKDEITKRVVSRVKKGSIVLFHNQGLHTAEAIVDIIKSLKQSGYQFVTIGELIYKENYRIDANGSQIKLNS